MKVNTAFLGSLDEFNNYTFEKIYTGGSFPDELISNKGKEFRNEISYPESNEIFHIYTERKLQNVEFEKLVDDFGNYCVRV